MASENEMKIIFGADTSPLRAEVAKGADAVQGLADRINKTADQASKGFDRVNKSVQGIPQSFEAVQRTVGTLNSLNKSIAQAASAAEKGRKSLDLLGQTPLNNLPQLDAQLKAIRATLSTGLKANLDTSAISPESFSKVRAEVDALRTSLSELGFNAQQTDAITKGLVTTFQKGFSQNVVAELNQAGVSVKQFQSALSSLTSGGANLAPLVNVLSQVETESIRTNGVVKNLSGSLEQMGADSKKPLPSLAQLEQGLNRIKTVLAGNFASPLAALKVPTVDFSKLQSEVREGTVSISQLGTAATTAFSKIGAGDVVLTRLDSSINKATSGAEQGRRALDLLGKTPLNNLPQLDAQLKSIKATLGAGLKANVDTSGLTPRTFNEVAASAKELIDILRGTTGATADLNREFNAGMAEGITETLREAGVSVAEFRQALVGLNTSGVDLSSLITTLDQIDKETATTTKSVKTLDATLSQLTTGGAPKFPLPPLADISKFNDKVKEIKATLASGFKTNIDKIKLSPADFTALEARVKAATGAMGVLGRSAVVATTDVTKLGRAPLTDLKNLDAQIRTIKGTLASGFKVDQIKLAPANFSVVARGADQTKVFNASIKQTQKSLTDLQKTGRATASVFSKGILGGLGVGIGFQVFQNAERAVREFVSGSIEQFAESQRAVNSLRQSLVAVGREDVFEGLITQSKALQNQFKFLDDDDVAASFQRLIQVGGLTEDQIRSLLPVIIDLNAKQRLAGDSNKTLADSAEDIIQGLNGQGRSLKQYGVELNASNGAAKNLSIILEQLGPKVKGAGDAFGNSLEGKIASSTARINELQEALGEKLLPLKAKLLQFANDVASGFGLLIDRLQLGASAFSAMQNLKVRVDFVQGKSTAKFDEVKDLPLDELTSKLIEYQAAWERTDKAIKAKKSSEEAITQWTLENEVMSDTIKRMKELIRLKGDDSKLGQHIPKEAKDHLQVRDAIQERIGALKQLIEAGVDVGKNSLELKDLDIKLILRDAKENRLTEDEVQKLIFAKYPDFKGGIELAKPINITAPVSLSVGIEKSIQQFDKAAIDLGAAQSRMYATLVKQGQEDGAKAREAFIKPLEQLNAAIASTLSNAFAGIGEAIGGALAGTESPVKAFLSVIADALDQLGKALIAFFIVKKLAVDALKSLNPYVALAAGIAAIAASKILKAQLSKETKLADGGIVMGPTRALIGEAGPEAVIPLSRASAFSSGGSAGPQEVIVRMHGNELIGVLNRAQGTRGRVA